MVCQNPNIPTVVEEIRKIEGKHEKQLHPHFTAVTLQAKFISEYFALFHSGSVRLFNIVLGWLVILLFVTVI